MTQIYIDPPRADAKGPKPGGLVDNINHYLPGGVRINHGDGVVVAVGLVVVTLLVLLAANLASAPVWVFGFALQVPLSMQWLLSFVAGAVCSLRFQHVRHRKSRR